jgi:hypothetical protein
MSTLVGTPVVAPVKAVRAVRSTRVVAAGTKTVSKPKAKVCFFPGLPLHLAIVFRGGRPRRGARCRLGPPRVRPKDRANRWLRYIVGLHDRRVPRSRA